MPDRTMTIFGRRWRGAALALAAGIVLAGCGSSAHGSSLHIKLVASTSRQTAAVFAEPPNSPSFYIMPLTPETNYNGNNDAEFQYLIYRPLYWFGQGSTPDFNSSLSLASTPVYTNGGRTAVITLKRYKWSDGVAVTSRDIVFWMNLLDVAKENWAGYVPGEFPDNVTSVRAEGPDKVAFTFNRVYNQNWLLYNELSQISPMPQHLWDKESASGPVGNWDTTAAGAKRVYNFLLKQGNGLSTYATNPLWKVVDGPWKIKSFNSANDVTLVPNTTYSGPVKPTLKEFKMVPFTSDAAEYNVLRAGGTIDFGYVPAQDASQIPTLRSEGWTVTAAAPWAINFTVLNFNNPTAGPIFKQLYVRQAMQALIDQKSWVKVALAGYGAATNGPVPTEPGNPFVSSLVKKGVYRYSPSTALSLLRSHGWHVVRNGTSTCTAPGTGSGHCGPGVRAGAKLQFKLEYAAGLSALNLGVQAMQSNFSTVGIKLDLVPEPLATVNAHETRCTASQSSCVWQIVQGDLAWTFQPDYYPEGALIFASRGSSNAGSYSDVTADKLIQATHISTSQQAMTAYENYVAEQLPVLWTPVPDTIVAVRSNLSGTEPADPFGNLYPEDWHWRKG